MSSELCFKTAVELGGLVRSGELSARELLEAHLEQIQRVNPRVNAIVTLTDELAREQAAAADEAQARGAELGPLHGLPVAHKDLVSTAGIRTTWGSPIYADFVPTEDALIIERLKSAGVIQVGKTNVPEFGAGSQTFNPVFGACLNPYDTSRTCGGSSGGAAVALACGMVPIADGSDTGGSLRNPANFCNVVGFRTSPGRVPVYPTDLGWFPISVQGPMARTVEDTALMLSALAGPDSRVPISLEEPGSSFQGSLERDFGGVRVAWSRDLGMFPVDDAVAGALESQLDAFETIGCSVDHAHPDFRDADFCFKTLRAWAFESKFTPLIEEHRDKIKETIIWNAEAGQRQSGPDVARAERLRTALFHRVREFMEEYEFLVLPVSQVAPFDVETPYITEINGQQMETYIDWMMSCYFITVTGLPALSLPLGFTEEGLPVGLQIVGRHRDDFGVLQLAYAIQQATRTWQRRPEVLAGA